MKYKVNKNKTKSLFAYDSFDRVFIDLEYAHIDLFSAEFVLGKKTGDPIKWDNSNLTIVSNTFVSDGNVILLFDAPYFIFGVGLKKYKVSLINGGVTFFERTQHISFKIVQSELIFNR